MDRDRQTDYALWTGCVSWILLFVTIAMVAIVTFYR